jgi:pyridoxal biosynthesis lyase PdxS
VIDGSRSRRFIAQKWRFAKSARLLSSVSGLERRRVFEGMYVTKEKGEEGTSNNSNAELLDRIFHSRRRYAAISAIPFSLDRSSFK